MSRNNIMINTPVININNLSKIYRLYTKPHYRFLDMLGLLKKSSEYFTEHAALKNLNLTIHKGEKLAIIGRNGAGKSTLLKLISGIIKPTNGEIKVTGNARALLQIGSGFHPDFTGRENVKAYLAQLGIVNHKTNQIIDEIIEFSELEEYIDQPLKTYSTGMAARLMFATSTAIAPDLLILDEILSVGDAYFTQKSMERIFELCNKENTTLLLVSHDIYSAAKICDRMIWIDSGELVFDENPQLTLKAYEDSIRAQEEKRLRKKSLINLENTYQCIKSDNEILLIEILAKENIPQPAPIYFSKIELFDNNELISKIPLLSQATEENNAGLILEHTCWSEPIVWLDMQCRAMQNYGSSHHKVAGYFVVANAKQKLSNQQLNLNIELSCPDNYDLILSVFLNSEPIYHSEIFGSQTDWTLINKSLTIDHNINKNILVNSTGHYGSGVLSIKKIILYNQKKEITSIFNHGEPLLMSFEYILNKPINDTMDIVLSILKDGVETSCRFYSRALYFNSTTKPGTINIYFNKIKLGIGEYSVNIMFAKNGYFDQSHHTFFTLNPDMYLCIRDAISFRVTGGNFISQGTSYVDEAKWSLHEHIEAELCSNE